MNSERMKQLRLEKKLTQKALGEICGIAEPTIRRYETGKLNPKIETVQKIALALDVSVGDLMDWSDFDRERNTAKLAYDTKWLEDAKKVGTRTFEMNVAFSKLNALGQKKAIAYLDDLLQVSKYCLPENEEQ